VLFLQYDNERGDGDLVYESGALLEGASIQTAAVASLFCDAPAREDDPVPEGTERTGFWADAFDESGEVWGSRLWLVKHMTVQEALGFAPRAAEEALAWMVRDGLALSAKASAERNGDHVRLSVFIHKPGEIASSLLGAWNLEVNHAVA
jgi:phage gp46-like protein